MADYIPRKGDIVKATTQAGVLRGVVISYHSWSPGRNTVDILINGMFNYRAYPHEISSINGLNVFDILREKGILAEKPKG